MAVRPTKKVAVFGNAAAGKSTLVRRVAKATCALNAGVSVRRVRRTDLLTTKNFFRPSHPLPGFMTGVTAYSAVQIYGATSQVGGAVCFIVTHVDDCFRYTTAHGRQ